MERVCSRAYFVRNGVLLDELSLSYGGGVHVELESPSEAEHLLAWTAAQGLQPEPVGGVDHPAYFLPTDVPTADVVRDLVRAGVRIIAVGDRARSLEERFLRLAQDERA